MSSLRQRLKNPRTWLALFATVLLLILLDSFRAPASQITGWGYVKFVHLYQWGGRPLLKGRVQCRFQPTCSEYSIEAVETHGIRWGLVLTYERLASCTHDVPLGTVDLVPRVDE
jgi:putative membrane protein insertion efficiency factor